MASEEYLRKLQDPRWQKKRLEIFERDGFECQLCGSTDKTLAIHHRRYIPGREPWDYPERLLVTLCKDCHETEKETRQEYEGMLITILREHFFADDIYTLTTGFINFVPTRPSSVIAEIIKNALTNMAIMDYLDDEYFNHLKERKDAENKIHQT